MSQPVIVATPEQLSDLVSSAVRKAIAELPASGTKEVLTLEEAAEFLGRHPKVLSKMVQRDNLPAHYISEREPRFLRSELIKWLTERDSQPRQLEA